MQHRQETILTANNRNPVSQLRHNLLQLSYLDLHIIELQLQVIVKVPIPDQVIRLLQPLRLPQHQNSLLLLIFQNSIRFHLRFFLLRLLVVFVVFLSIPVP